MFESSMSRFAVDPFKIICSTFNLGSSSIFKAKVKERVTFFLEPFQIPDYFYVSKGFRKRIQSYSDNCSVGLGQLYVGIASFWFIS